MKKTIVNQFVRTIVLIFVLLSTMLIYFFISFYKSSSKDIKQLGISNTKSQATMVEEYLDKGRSVLWLAAESVDFMVNENVESAKIQTYLKSSTKQMQKQFDVNFMEIYGWINGEYISGSGWIPPEDYYPTERVWYTKAKLADGEMVLSEPYVDARTGDIIISFSCLLSDGESVVAVDIALNQVQSIVKNMTMSGIGYGMIINSEGMVISHCDDSEAGKQYGSTYERKKCVDDIIKCDGKVIQLNIDGYESTVFSEKIANDWYVIIICSNDELFEKIRNQIYVGCVLATMVFFVIVGFCIFSADRIKRAEESENESLEKLDRLNSNIIRALASTIDAKDRYTSGHSQRVAEYALAIAKRMGKSEEEQKVILYAALLHDVGKISVPNEVINKPGRLTDEEFEQIQIHPVSGYHILKDIHENSDIGEGAKYHHERYDGKGYPNGLKSFDIPEVARIIGVADAYDAMASNRSYRNALPQNVIREEIERGKGKQFDPEIADIMLQMIDEDKDYLMCQREKVIANVLIITDNKDDRDSLKKIIGELSYVCIMCAETGKEAKNIIKNNKISLILLDSEICKGDSILLYSEICNENDISVIMMVSENNMDTLHHLRELKIDDYINKPYSPFVVREIVHGIINSNNTEVLWEKDKL